MAGLEWIKVATDLRENGKSLRLCAMLKDRRGWSWVAALWMWCAEQQADGHVPGPEDEALAMIEFGAGWDGVPGQLGHVLLTCGFIEKDGEGGFIVHDWLEWQPAHVEKKSKEAIRKANYRAQKKEAVGQVSQKAGQVSQDKGDKCPEMSGTNGTISSESREKRVIQKQLPCAGLCPPPAAKPKKLAPQVEAYEHWKATVWPLLSEAPCPAAGDAVWTNAAARCKEVGLSGVKAAMDRLAAKLRAGEVFHPENVTLLGLLTTSFERYVSRNGAVVAPIKANNGARPVARNWWDSLDPDQRRGFMAERARLAPELGEAPFDVAAEIGQEPRAEVVEMLARWRSIAEGTERRAG